MELRKTYIIIESFNCITFEMITPNRNVSYTNERKVQRQGNHIKINESMSKLNLNVSQLR